MYLRPSACLVHTYKNALSSQVCPIIWSYIRCSLQFELLTTVEMHVDSEQGCNDHPTRCIHPYDQLTGNSKVD